MTRITQYGDVTVEFVFVTPKIAAEWLALNHPDQRPPAPSKEDRFTRDMLAGRWLLNGDTIRFQIDGKLIDGQGRLRSCVKSGVPFWAIVVCGLSLDAFKTIDIGQRRTLRNILMMLGKGISGSVPAAAQWIARYERDDYETGLKFSSSATPDEIIDIIDRYDDILDSCRTAEPANAYVHAPALAVTHLFGRMADPLKADDFVRHIKSNGAGLGQSDPISVLLKRMRDSRVKRTMKLNRYEVFLLVARTWNIFIKGETRTKVQRPDEGERFPLIIGDPRCPQTRKYTTRNGSTR